jgi:hypothetical protein
MGYLLVGVTPQVILVVKVTDHKPLRLDIGITRSNAYPLKENNKKSESRTCISNKKKNTYLGKAHPSVILRLVVPGLIQIPEVWVNNSKVVHTQ